MFMKNTLIMFTAYAVLKMILFIDLQLRFIPEVTFLNVGQGDSILIVTPDGKKLLVDGGPDFTADSYLNDYFPLNNCSLEAVFLTHPHQDHLEGLLRVLDHCKVRSVFYNEVSYSSGLYLEWAERLEERASNTVRPFVAGDSLLLGELELYGLWPSPEYLKNPDSNINNSSLVFLVKHGNFEALLTGDAEDPVLRQLPTPSVKGRLDVYKLSHHGSRNGLNYAFWKALNPINTVISVGVGNSFGHPHADVLGILQNEATLIRRTDVDGTVKIRYNSL